MARPGGAAPHRRASASPDLDGRRWAAVGRSRSGQRHLVRHGAGSLRGRRGVGSRRNQRLRPALRRRANHRVQPRRDLVAVDRRGGARRLRNLDRRDRQRHRRAAATTQRRVPHADGLQSLSHRARDASLPSPPRRQRPRPQSHDDPVGLVHDEAQRHRRDAATDVARAGRHASIHA